LTKKGGIKTTKRNLEWGRGDYQSFFIFTEEYLIIYIPIAVPTSPHRPRSSPLNQRKKAASSVEICIVSFMFATYYHLQNARGAYMYPTSRRPRV
jgi:hypothetical protein